MKYVEQVTCDNMGLNTVTWTCQDCGCFGQRQYDRNAIDAFDLQAEASDDAFDSIIDHCECEDE